MKKNTMKNKDDEKIKGRPKDGLETLPKTWYISVLELYKEGGSDVEVKALIWEMKGSFSNDLWDRWMSEEPIFSETIKKGKQFSEAWWHRNGRVNLTEQNFNYTGWYMQMRNRFGWGNKNEPEKEQPQSITINKYYSKDAD